MTYEVRLSRDAVAYLQRLDPDTRERIEQRLRQLATDPFDIAYSKPLTGLKGVRSARVGGFRIIFSVDQEARVLNVTAIGPRGQIYRDA